MDESYKQNVEQIASLVHSKQRSDKNRHVELKRLAAARREIRRLRDFAYCKPGSKVYTAVMTIADEAERALEEALRH